MLKIYSMPFYTARFLFFSFLKIGVEGNNSTMVFKNIKTANEFFVLF